MTQTTTGRKFLRGATVATAATLAAPAEGHVLCQRMLIGPWALTTLVNDMTGGG